MEKVEHILKNAKRAHMSSGEKEAMRGAISAFMASRPRREAVVSPYGGGWTGVFSMKGLHVFQARYVQALLIVFLATGGTLSAAAEKALPGDPLYAVKINFNEKMTTVLAFSPEAKALREADLAERRLKEAADLSAQGRLTSEARSQIESNLESHVENIEKQVKELASNDDLRQAVEVNSELESTLRVHEKVMLELSAASPEAEKVASTIREELSAVSRSLTKLEDRLPNEISTEAEAQAREKEDKASRQAEEAQIAVEGAADLRKEAVTQAVRHMERALYFLGEGRDKLNDGQYNRAFILFMHSMRYSRAAVLTVDTNRELNIAPSPEPQEASSTTTPTTTPEDAGAQATSTGEDLNSGTTTATTTAEGNEIEARVDIETMSGAEAVDLNEGFPNTERLRSQSRSGIRGVLKLPF